MNRAMRRQAARYEADKAKRERDALTQEQKKQELFKNGITLDDVDKAYRDGLEAGYKQAGFDIVKTAYAAIALALHEELGFGHKRVMRMLEAVDKKTILCLNGQDMVDDVYDSLKIRMNFSEPMDRVEDAS